MSNKSRQAAASYARKSRGSFMIFVAILGVFILLPLGLAGFEINRMSMAQTQLRTATDAAVLAASQAYRNALGKAGGNELDIAKTAGAKFFKMNCMLGGNLSNATPAGTIDGVHPQANESVIAITFDGANNIMTAQAAAGMQYAFGGMFGNIAVPLIAYSKANVVPQEETDVVIILDRTGSMADDNALTQAKPVICNFVSELTHDDYNHFGLVCYNSTVTSTVALSSTAVKADEVKAMINAQSPNGSTGTAGGMSCAYNMLCGSGHRPTASRLLVLVTDGLPNVALNGSGNVNLAKSDCYNEGTKIGQTSIPPPPNGNDPPQDTQGIKLAAIGFFHSDQSTLNEGTTVLNEIASRVKSGGEQYGAEAYVYTASNIQELQDALNKISANEIGLVN
jgi:hypothetical protein